MSKRRGLSDFYGSLPATVAYPGKQAVRDHVGREIAARRFSQQSAGSSSRWNLERLAEGAAEDLELASQGLEEWAKELEEEDQR
jgi:hypothetical protein